MWEKRKKRENVKFVDTNLVVRLSRRRLVGSCQVEELIGVIGVGHLFVENIMMPIEVFVPTVQKKLKRNEIKFENEYTKRKALNPFFRNPIQAQCLS